MKTKLKVYGVITFIVIIGFALYLAGCSDGGGNGGDNGPIIRPIGIEMVRIPAGTFTMGSPTSEAGRGNGETQKQVTLSAFSIGKYEVTQEQYQAVMGSNPSYFTSAVAGESGTPGKLPVEQVSWYDALVFCNKLSMMEGLSPAYSIFTGTDFSTDPAVWGDVPTSDDPLWNLVPIVPGSNGYRLPTDEQWEYACRAGTTTAFNDGNNDYTNATAVGAVGWYISNSGTKTHQVGLKTANAWGLYDMHGNVYEWCWQESPISKPTVRGGALHLTGKDLRSASVYVSNRYESHASIGFRLVRP